MHGGGPYLIDWFLYDGTSVMKELLCSIWKMNIRCHCFPVILCQFKQCISCDFFENSKRLYSVRVTSFSFPTGIFLSKDNHGNTRTIEVCLKLTIKTPEQCQRRRSSVFVVTINIFHTLFFCFHCWLWARKCPNWVNTGLCQIFMNMINTIRDESFKNELTQICGRQPLKILNFYGLFNVSKHCYVFEQLFMKW